MIYLILSGILFILTLPLIFTATLLSKFTGLGVAFSMTIIILIKIVFKIGIQTLMKIFLFLCILWLLFGYLY